MLLKGFAIVDMSPLRTLTARNEANNKRPEVEPEVVHV